MLQPTLPYTSASDRPSKVATEVPLVSVHLSCHPIGTLGNVGQRDPLRGQRGLSTRLICVVKGRGDSHHCPVTSPNESGCCVFREKRPRLLCPSREGSRSRCWLRSPPAGWSVRAAGEAGLQRRGGGYPDRSRRARGSRRRLPTPGGRPRGETAPRHEDQRRHPPTSAAD